MQQVVKRDGKIVDFNSEKITSAIQKAAQTTNEFNAQTARQLTRQVIDITRKIAANISKTSFVKGGFIVYFGELAIKKKVGLNSWKTMSWADDKSKILSTEKILKVSISYINAMTGAPVTKQARFDMIGGERLVKQKIITQIQLRYRKIITQTNAVANLVDGLDVDRPTHAKIPG